MRSARGSWCLLRLGHRMLLFAWLRGACSAPGRPPKAPVLTRGHMHVTSRGSKFPRGVEITVPICIVPARAGTAAAGLRRADRGDDRKRKRPRPRRVPGRRHGRLPVQARAQEPPRRGHHAGVAPCRVCRPFQGSGAQGFRHGFLSKPVLKKRLAEAIMQVWPLLRLFVAPFRA